VSGLSNGYLLSANPAADRLRLEAGTAAGPKTPSSREVSADPEAVARALPAPVVFRIRGDNFCAGAQLPRSQQTAEAGAMLNRSWDPDVSLGVPFLKPESRVQAFCVLLAAWQAFARQSLSRKIIPIRSDPYLSG